MKKGLSLFLSLLMVIGIMTSVPVTVSAASVDDLTFYLNEDGTSYSVTGCDTSAEGELVIPDTYEGLPVTSIGYGALMDCRNLTSITIPDSVTSIGEAAFYYCSSLASITIPDSVVSIGDSAFYYCTSLNSITIPDNVTNLGYAVFCGCSNLASIIIPDSVTSIGNEAFWYCSSLTSITIPDSVTSIGSYAFADTEYFNTEAHWENGVLYIGNHLVAANYFDKNSFEYVGNVSGEYNIKAGTRTIAGMAFAYCINLTSITIPDSVKTIGSSAFSNCTSLASIEIPDSVISIGSSAFSNCTSLTSIEIPDSVKSIGSSAFYGCTKLTSITIPDSITSIEIDTFAGCTKLTSITIPDSVTSIGNYAFLACYALVDVYYLGSKAQWDKINIGGHNENLINADIHYTEEHIHISSSWITDTKATVYKAGSKHKECTQCGEVLKTAKIDQLKCSKPKLSKIENTEYGVKITWSKVSGADKYDVYGKTGSKGKYSKIGSTTKTYYTDKKASSGKKYYYYVKAVNETGSSSASSSKSIYHLADTTLSTPKSTKSGITLKWKKVTGADGYMVYRKTGLGSYSKIATVKGNIKVTYTDKSAKKGKKYTYKIKAYKSKTYSAYSNTKTIKDKY